MYDNASVLVRVGPPLCRDGVSLAYPFSDVDVAVLEHGNGVAEDEVDGPIDVTVTVELAL